MLFHLTHRKRTFSPILKLSMIRFLLTLGVSGIDVIWILYMNQLGFSTSFIGFFSAFLTSISLLVLLNSPKILDKFGEKNVLIFTMSIYLLSLLILGLFKDKLIFLIIGTIAIIAYSFRVECFDILFRDESNTEDLSKNEGLYFTFINLGWFIGPLLVAVFIYYYNIQKVFLLSSFFIFLVIFLIYRFKFHEKEHKIKKSSMINDLKEYLSLKNLKYSYFFSMGVAAWWAFIYIYIPLYLIEKNLNEMTIVLCLSIIALPLILLEFEVGKLQSKNTFKKYFSIAFILLGLISISLLFIDSIFIIIPILIIASFPMAFIEPMVNAYFFKNCDSDCEEHFYPLYATSDLTGSTIIKIIIAISLLFVPIIYSFLIVGIIMIILGLLALKIDQ